MSICIFLYFFFLSLSLPFLLSFHFNAFDKDTNLQKSILGKNKCACLLEQLTASISYNLMHMRNTKITSCGINFFERNIHVDISVGGRIRQASQKWYQILKIWTGLKDNFMTLRSLNSSAANCIYYFFGGQ